MATLRVTAGSLRGRRIHVPPRDVRPTSERARQAYFNIVADRIHGARFLDLFAGSGVFSFEALSRGARSAVAIDVSRRHTAAIADVAQELGVGIETITADVLAGIARLEDRVFDLVYADPPYDYATYDELLAAIDEKLGLTEGAVVAIEHRKRREPFTVETKRLAFVRGAEYGEVWISMYECRTQNDE
jgi:16S rRNA (guanine966-N2)-methyltransferase